MEATESDIFGAPERATGALDRRIDLTAISWYAVAWAAVLALAAAIRIAGAGSWPLGSTEAGIASDAYNLLHGGAVSSTGAAHPLATNLASLAFFLFGASDGIVRLIPVLAGILTVALCWPLRHLIGRAPALGAALVAALSPALAFAAERLDGAALLTLASLLLLLALGAAGHRAGLGSGLLLGTVAALIPLSDPLGWLALPLVAIAGLALLNQDERPRLTLAPWVLLGFATAILVISTSLLTRPAGLTTFFSAGFSALWHQQLGNLGQLWQLPAFELIIDDLAAVVFAIVALLALKFEGGRLRVLGWWTLAALLLASLLGAKSSPSYALVALPLALLAGAGLAWLLERVPWRLFGTFSGWGFVVALLATIAAALSAIGVLLGLSNSSTIDTVLQFVLLVVVILAPLLLLTIRLSRGIPRAWPLVVLVGVLLLGGLGLRTSALLASTTESRTGSILTAGSTDPDVGSLVERLQTVSRDLTDLNQSALDPTGGHGLTIAVDSSIAEPFRWYFREYPSFQVVPNAKTVTPAPQVIITEALPTTGTGRAARGFAYQTTLATTLARPNWGRLLSAVLDPNQVRHFLGYLIDHRVANPPPSRQFTLSLSPDVGQRLFGVSP